MINSNSIVCILQLCGNILDEKLGEMDKIPTFKRIRHKTYTTYIYHFKTNHCFNLHGLRKAIRSYMVKTRVGKT